MRSGREIGFGVGLGTASLLAACGGNVVTDGSPVGEDLPPAIDAGDFDAGNRGDDGSVGADGQPDSGQPTDAGGDGGDAGLEDCPTGTHSTPKGCIGCADVAEVVGAEFSVALDGWTPCTSDVECTVLRTGGGCWNTSCSVLAINVLNLEAATALAKQIGAAYCGKCDLAPVCKFAVTASCVAGSCKAALMTGP